MNDQGPDTAAKRAKKITELCQLADKPELAAQFIAQGTSPAHVRAMLAAAAPNILEPEAVAQVYQRRAAEVAAYRERGTP
jgi:hypothetical protein